MELWAAETPFCFKRNCSHFLLGTDFYSSYYVYVKNILEIGYNNCKKWTGIQHAKKENVEAVRNTDLYTSKNATEYALILPVFNQYFFWVGIQKEKWNFVES